MQARRGWALTAPAIVFLGGCHTLFGHDPGTSPDAPREAAVDQALGSERRSADTRTDLVDLPGPTEAAGDLAKPDLAKLDLAKPDAKPDLAKPDLAKPDAPSCSSTCWLGCTGTGACRIPTNIAGVGDLPTACLASLPSPATVCSNNLDCRIVSGSNCQSTAICGGKVITQPALLAGKPAQACIFTLSGFRVVQDLRIVGVFPAVLLFQDGLKLKGTIDLSADGATPGAGGGAGAMTGGIGVGPGGGGTCNLVGSTRCGGGGGGFTSVGGNGGAEAGAPTVSAGGPKYGSPSLEPLVGGSGGGGAGGPAMAAAGGGGGGGALQISAMSITIEGKILATGGPGKGGQCISMAASGGGGGGAGGGVLLETPTLSLTGSVVVHGGGGGGGASCMSLPSAIGSDGTEGNGIVLPAGGTGSPTGNGGMGATSGSGLPGASLATGGPGGGGGGAGAIRLVYVGAACPPVLPANLLGPSSCVSR